MKYILLIKLFLFALFSQISAQNLKSIYSDIEQYQNSRLLKNAQWALYAVYIDSKTEIINLNPERSLVPASGLKVFTTTAALAILGEDYQFVTKIYTDGKIDEAGNLNGNLYFVGDGDPALGSDLAEGSLSLDELMDRIFSELKKRGIKKIAGSIIADDLKYNTKPIPDHWEWTDIGNYYGASSTSLTINENSYSIYFQPAKKVNDNAEFLRTEPEIPNLTFTNFMKTGPAGSGDNGYVFNAPGQYNAALYGTIPQGYNEFKIKGSIPDPPIFAVQYLHDYLNRNDIIIEKKPYKTNTLVNYSGMKEICRINSPYLKDIVTVVNRKSNNLYAELLLKAIAFKKTGSGSTEKGAEEVEKHISAIGINTDGVMLYDGSGLSRENVITARSMVELLSYNPKQSYWPVFYNSLVSDENNYNNSVDAGGNMKFGKGARIKSGSMLGVRSHSGYVIDKEGRTIVFSFIANNFDGPGGQVSTIHKELIKKLSDLGGKQ